MFGQMRRCKHQMLPYCGTCKTIGRLFGQRARLTLNHDAVFLGELLLLLDGQKLAPSFTTRKCLSLPMAQELPRALVYAASANLALTELVVRDKRADGEGAHWAVVEQGLGKAFGRARAQLRAFGLPIERLFALHDDQTQQEARPTTLDALATPTGTATALVFSHGSPLLAELGDAFGRLVYALDALTDRASDRKRGAFNALAATATTTPAAHAYIREQETRSLAALQALPLPDSAYQRFASQLQQGVGLALMEADESAPTGVGQRQRRRRGEQTCWADCQDACSCPDCCGDCVCDGTCDACSSCCESNCCHGCHGCDCGGCDCCGSS